MCRGSSSATPSCTNKNGHGPAWANAVFEDNAEFGFGIQTGVTTARGRIKDIMTEAIEKCNCCSSEIKALFGEGINNMEDSASSVEVTNKLIPLMEKCDCQYCKDILGLKQYMIKKSVWIFGVYGWSYDIVYGGLDHVMASGESVTILGIDP